MTESDRRLLRRCVALARLALDEGDAPFGSLLTDASGSVLFVDRNRTGGGDPTLHPEFAIARWAAGNLAPDERRSSVVYTSGEHCPMCSAAHAFVGLGRIVYASSTAQLISWRHSLGFTAAPVAGLPINVVAPDVPVSGPDPSLSEEIRALHAEFLGPAED
ncbi:hypothetical protein STSO111631_00395 [Stackebrandtia soli]